MKRKISRLLNVKLRLLLEISVFFLYQLELLEKKSGWLRPWLLPNRRGGRARYYEIGSTDRTWNLTPIMVSATVLATAIIANLNSSNPRSFLAIAAFYGLFLSVYVILIATYKAFKWSRG